MINGVNKLAKIELIDSKSAPIELYHKVDRKYKYKYKRILEKR